MTEIQQMFATEREEKEAYRKMLDRIVIQLMPRTDKLVSKLVNEAAATLRKYQP